MMFLCFDDDAAGGVGVPAAVVPHECSAEHVGAPVDLFAVDLVRQRGLKSVVRSAQCNDRFAGINVLHDQFAFIHWQCEQPGEKDDKVSRGKVFEPWNVMRFELALLSLFRINRHR